MNPKDLCACEHKREDHDYTNEISDDCNLCMCQEFTPQDPNLNFKDTSSTGSLGERTSNTSNTQHQVESSEATSVSLAGQGKASDPVYCKCKPTLTEGEVCDCARCLVCQKYNSPPTKPITANAVDGESDLNLRSSFDGHKTGDLAHKTFEEMSEITQRMLVEAQEDKNQQKVYGLELYKDGLIHGRELTLKEVSEEIEEDIKTWMDAIGGRRNCVNRGAVYALKCLKTKLSALSGDRK